VAQDLAGGGSLAREEADPHPAPAVGTVMMSIRGVRAEGGPWSTGQLAHARWSEQAPCKTQMSGHDLRGTPAGGKVSAARTGHSSRMMTRVEILPGVATWPTLRK
jgi:hypothetical protein